MNHNLGIGIKKDEDNPPHQKDQTVQGKSDGSNRDNDDDGEFENPWTTHRSL